MPYMEAIVLESVRMFMSRTFGIPHRALKDTTLMDYNIPKVMSYNSKIHTKNNNFNHFKFGYIQAMEFVPKHHL